MLRYIQIIQKWWWLVLLLCILTISAGLVISRLAGTHYEATTTLQMSAPPSTEAALYGQIGKQALDDVIKQQRVSFNELLLTRDVAERALKTLPHITMTASELQQRLTTELPDDTQFVYVRVRAADPETAASLAAAVAETGRQRFGGVLAQPVTNTRQFIEQELATASADLEAAETELTQFQITNKIWLLQSAMDAEYEAIRSLRLARDLAEAEGDTARAKAMDGITLEREAHLQDMIGLAIEYNRLANRVERTRETYDFLLDQQTEAHIKEAQLRQAGFIQVLTSIGSPPKPVRVINQTLIGLGGIGSVVVGVALAFFLEQLQLSGVWRGFQPRLTLPTFSPRLKGLMLFPLLLFFLIIPSVLCHIARNQAIQKVAEVIKVNEVAPAVQETPLPLKAPISLPTALPSPEATPTTIPTVIANTIAIATLQLLPTFDLDRYTLSTPIPSLTLSPTPVPVYGLVTMPGSQRLNVRAGPGVAYEIVAQLKNGDKFLILQRTPTGDWLEIETPGRQKGWVTSQYVEILGDIDAISVATNLATPSAAGQLLTLNIEGGTGSGQLVPGQEQWYAFFEQDEETVLVFMFMPPVGPNQVQFFLYDQKQIPVWPPKAPEALAHIGASSYPASDRDGDERTIELIWRGGPLVPSVRYYLRFVNHSNTMIQYCLATTDIYQWNCPKN